MNAVRRLRPGLRLRLTLVYGGLFLAAGTVLLGLTYVLVDRQMPRNAKFISAQKVGPGQVVTDEVLLKTIEGRPVSAAEAPAYLAEQQERIRNDAMTSLLTQGGIALGLVGCVSVGFGWLITGRMLGPLRRVTETAQRIAEAPAADRGLHERIAMRGPDDEVKELADTFDTMVERLDQSFESQRRFVANASHELRTPLTLNRALVELAMHRASASAEVRQLGEALLEINGRHERLINGLLLLARSESEILERTEIDLADLVSHVTAQSAAEARQTGVDLIEDAHPARTCGDPVLLERLAQNLVENGIRHNVPDGGFVRVSSRPIAGGGAQLEVANTGEVIPPYDVAGLFEPFRRRGTERLVTAKGAGLGLSIARSVAAAHGGEVSARPRTGGGLVVTVTLPPARLATPSPSGDPGGSRAGHARARTYASAVDR